MHLVDDTWNMMTWHDCHSSTIPPSSGTWCISKRIYLQLDVPRCTDAISGIFLEAVLECTITRWTLTSVFHEAINTYGNFLLAHRYPFWKVLGTSVLLSRWSGEAADYPGEWIVGWNILGYTNDYWMRLGWNILVEPFFSTIPATKSYTIHIFQMKSLQARDLVDEGAKPFGTGEASGPFVQISVDSSG